MKNKPDEPVLNVAAITAAASAIIALVVAFLPDALTEIQSVAIMGVVAVAAPLIVAAIGRGKVTPNSAVAERVVGDMIVAGEANERIPEGDVVREVDVLPRRAVDGSF